MKTYTVVGRLRRSKRTVSCTLMKHFKIVNEKRQKKVSKITCSADLSQHYYALALCSWNLDTVQGGGDRY